MSNPKKVNFCTGRELIDSPEITMVATTIGFQREDGTIEILAAIPALGDENLVATLASDVVLTYGLHAAKNNHVDFYTAIGNIMVWERQDVPMMVYGEESEEPVAT